MAANLLAEGSYCFADAVQSLFRVKGAELPATDVAVGDLRGRLRSSLFL
jgi:hypothetical protein